MSAEGETVFIEGGGGFVLEIVGESHHQNHLKQFCGGFSREGSCKNAKAVLHYENNNPRDKQAIRVDIDGKSAGYLSREDATLYRKKIRNTGHEGIIVSCNALITGGKKLGLFNKTSFGVWLDLPIDDL